jgi:hypothetical protein
VTINRQRASTLLSRLSFCLALLAPFLVFFDPSVNVDLQAYIILIVGASSWLALSLQIKPRHNLSTAIAAPLMMLLTLGLLSSFFNPDVLHNLIGNGYVRLGFFELLSCVGLGMLVRQQKFSHVLLVIYLEICLVSLVAIPYTLYDFGSLCRIGGVFAQPDIFATVLGVGYLIGFEMIRIFPSKKLYVSASQLIIAGLLLMTQTRAVIAFTFVLSLIAFWVITRSIARCALLLSLYVLIICIAAVITPNRLTDINYSQQSINYRLHMDIDTVNQSWSHALLGYGFGNLGTPLNCTQLQSTDLQKTCHDGYVFNSSHNIYIDRILEVGWLAGVCFMSLAIVSIRNGMQLKSKKIASLAAALIALYYLTNVTSVTLELLFWCLLIALFPMRTKANPSSALP